MSSGREHLQGKAGEFGEAFEDTREMTASLTASCRDVPSQLQYREYSDNAVDARLLLLTRTTLGVILPHQWSTFLAGSIPTARLYMTGLVDIETIWVGPSQVANHV